LEAIYDKNGRPLKEIRSSFRMPVKGSRMIYVRSICKSKQNDDAKEWNRSVGDLVVQLNQSQIILFFMLSEHCDDFNVLQGKVSDIVSKFGEKDRHTVSRMKHALIKAKAIIEYNNGIMLNPFAILPVYNPKNPEGQFKAQQLWRHINYDTDAHFDGIYEYISMLFPIK